LEFAVALKLREIMIPVAPIAAILGVLREFEKKVSREIPGFSLPEGLRQPRAPDLRIVITDGGKLFFTLGKGNARPKAYGGLDVGELQSAGKTGQRRGYASIRSKLPPARLPVRGGNAQARVEVNVTRVARDLLLNP
jgi:hypothetical protein